MAHCAAAIMTAMRDGAPTNPSACSPWTLPSHGLAALQPWRIASTMRATPPTMSSGGWKRSSRALRIRAGGDRAVGVSNLR